MLASKISDDIEEITKPTFKTYDEAFNSSRYIIQDGNVIDNETGEIVDTLDNFKLNPKKRTPLTNEEVLKQIKSEVSPEYYDKVKDFMSDDNIIDSFDLKNIKTEIRKTPLDEVSNVKKERTPIEKIKTEQKPNPQVKPEPKKQPKPETKPTFNTYDEAFKNDKIIIDDGYKCLPSTLEIIDDYHAKLTIHEGKFHQVKRMFEKANCTVTYLQRIEFGPLKLNDLPLGEFRALTQEELNALKS